MGPHLLRTKLEQFFCRRKQVPAHAYSGWVRRAGSPRGGRWPGGGSRNRLRSEVRRTRGPSGSPGRHSPLTQGVRRVRRTP